VTAVTSGLASAKNQLAELAPLVRRVVALDPAALVRIRIDRTTAGAAAWLPFRMLVERTVPARWSGESLDVAVSGHHLQSWLDGEAPAVPPSRDADWHHGLPPRTGWRRLDTVPDDVVRSLVRQGALGSRVRSHALRSLTRCSTASYCAFRSN
jgi:hypothetical protein